MKEYNIVVIGVGGQGILTLTKILADAAMFQGHDIKTSELHGLSQRDGTIPCHIRFGKKIHSSVIMQGEAHLVIGLEPLEALRACYFGSKANKTVFVINNHKRKATSIKRYPSLENILKNIKQFSKKRIILNATDTVKDVGGKEFLTNIYMLGYASRFIPLDKKYLIKAMKTNLKPKYFELNKKMFELGSKL